MAMNKEGVRQMTQRPLFYVQGRDIFQRPVKRPNLTVTMGFRICTVADEINPNDLCNLLNEVDKPPADEPSE